MKHAGLSGGGLDLGYMTHLRLEDVTLTDCSSPGGDGGGISIQTINNVDMYNVTVRNTIARAGGGIRSASGLQFTARNITIVNASVSDSSGCMQAQHSQRLFISGFVCQYGNSALDGGGFGFHYTRFVELDNFRVEHCACSRSGGGGYFYLNRFITIQNMYFHNISGGAFMVNNVTSIFTAKNVF
eukprot:PhF_6_TR26689/c0_g2_i5/m.38888